MVDYMASVEKEWSWCRLRQVGERIAIDGANDGQSCVEVLFSLCGILTTLRCLSKEVDADFKIADLISDTEG